MSSISKDSTLKSQYEITDYIPLEKKEKNKERKLILHYNPRLLPLR